MTWGRLALIHAAGESDDALKAIAHLLGYEAETEAEVIPEQDFPPRPSAGDFDRSDTTEPVVPVDYDSFKPAPQPSARFLCVNKLIQHVDPNETESHPHDYLYDPDMRLTADSAPKRSYTFAAPASLFSMPRLLPLLHNALGQPRQGCRIDYSRLTRLLANGRPIRRLPQLTRLRWPQRLQIIVDTRTALEPYWSDFAEIVAQLKRLMGTEAVTALRFAEETFGKLPAHAIAWPTQPNDEWVSWRTPASDEAILILSDLASNDSNADARLRWQQWLRRLQFHPAPILTLSPASQSVRNKRLCRIAKPSPLNDLVTPSRHPSQRGFRLPQADAESVTDILALLSPLPLIDKSLLRQLRQAFQWGGSDLEHRIWNHPDMRSIGLGIQLSEAAAKGYQQRYREKFVNSFQSTQLWQLVHAHHHAAFEGLRQLENLNRCTLEHSNDNDAVRHYFRKLSATLAQTTADTRQKQALLQQCRTVLQCLPKQIWQSQLDDVAYDLYALAHQDDIRAGRWPDKMEPGFDPNRLLWVLDSKQQQERVRWSIHQTGPLGELVCQQQTPAATSAPPIAQFDSHPAFPPTYRLQCTDDQNAATLRNGQTFQLKDDLLTIKTRWQQLELKTIEKPTWAIDMWCHADGMMIQLPPWRGHSPIVRWQPGKTGENGNWLLPNPFGCDQFGLYADLEILSRGVFKKLFRNSNSIIQRFRWITPGTFMMGSPSDELERESFGIDETQHPVTLTQGFWLAESTCTQALWQAVMGKNPSRFQDNENNPVETVSWDDTQSFITQLNTLFPGLSARLPTEAEWEYACRAGTGTPFSFGDNITPEQVNYHGNYPYAGGEKGLYRGRTVPVKSLPPNPWGLYEMHGYVWEWCADWYGDYPRQAVTDPLGPDHGKGRVLRGGSWISIGGGVRSAIRSRSGPDLRNVYIGFRLALG